VCFNTAGPNTKLPVFAWGGRIVEDSDIGYERRRLGVCVCVDCLIGKQKKSPRPVWTSLPTPPRPLYSKRPCDFPNDSVWKTCGNEICAIFVINDSAPGKDTLLHSRVSFPGRVNTSHLRIPYCFNTPP